MFLEDFLNANSDWQDQLAVSPYNIETKQDGCYYMLKYTTGMSDFEKPEVIEARGPIFRQEINGRWKCVCRSLDKFGNYEESYAVTPKIDWSKGVDVQEKIDGSIMRIWYDMDEWHISTNGAIDAFKVTCGLTNFGDLFLRILGLGKIDRLDEYFDRENCYWFELVSPLHNRIVIKYPEDRVYFLGARNMQTMEELDREFSFGELDNVLWRPKHFSHYSLGECIEAAHRMGDDEEGYVCVSAEKENGSHLRIKVKGDEYFALHKLREPGALTVQRVIEMWQNEELDDYVACNPEYKDFVDEVIAIIRQLIDASDNAFKTVTSHSDIHEQRDFAKYANEYDNPLRAFLYSRYSAQSPNATAFYKSMRPQTLEVLVIKNLTQKQTDVAEDE